MGDSIFGGTSSPGSSGPKSIFATGKDSKKKKKRGGIGGFVGRFGSEIAQAAINSPGGLYSLGKTVYDDTYDAGRALSPKDDGGDLDFNRSRGAAKGIAEQTWKDLQDPIGHPGNFALSVLGIASLGAGTAARAGAAGKAAAAGKGARGAVAAAAKIKPEPRIVRSDGAESVSGQYSRSAATRAAQKLVDKAREAFPETPLIPVRTQPSRFGRAETRNRKISEGIARADAAALLSEGKKLSAGEQKAIQVQAEGATTAQRIAFHSKELQNPKLTGKARRRTQQEIVYLLAARQYLDETGGTPKIADSKLSGFYTRAKAEADRRTDDLIKAGALSPEAAEGRIAYPGEMIRAAIGDDVYSTGSGDFRVPYATKRPKAALGQIAGSGTNSMVGKTRKPGSLTHPFEGKILEQGGGRNDTTTLVAESSLEAQRFTHLVRARERIAEIATDDPNLVPDQHRVAVNVDALNTVPQAVRDILDRATDPAQLSGDEVRALGVVYESIREQVFPDVRKVPDEQIKGFKWIDRRKLGGLEKQNPLIGFQAHAGVRRALSINDQINSAQKFALLYLKPAYAVPNLLGNAALTMIQQGVFAPVNLTKAARLNAKFGHKSARAIDEVMGDGIMAMLGNDPGFMRRATNMAARGYGTFVDRPFRRASFLHEARRLGYTTRQDLTRLLFDEKLRDQLTMAVQRANSELIDYARLGPVEKHIVARVVFFYPWVKGSTVYSARFLGEHPAQAALTSQLGQLGADEQYEGLGPVPDWYKGLIRTGGTDAAPRVINPTAASLFQTPAELAKMLLATAGVGEGAPPSASFTPSLGFLQTLISGKNGLGFDLPQDQSRFEGAIREMYEGIPAYQLQQRLRGQQTSKTSTYSEKDALLKFLFGITPFTVDRERLNRQADR